MLDAASVPSGTVPALALAALAYITVILFLACAAFRRREI